MRKLLVLAAAAASLTQISSAAPVCMSGTLSSYVGIGSTGCMIGSDLLSNFQVLRGTTGATEISPLSITLTPIGNTANPGLVTTANVVSPAGSVNEVLFTYQLSGNTYSSSTLTLANASESGQGAVTGVQNFCAGGAFGANGVSGCTGVPGSLVTVDGTQNQDFSVFNAVLLLSVTNDLTIDGGTAGSASGGQLTNQFTAGAGTVTPEPVSLLLTALGLVFTVGWRWKLTSAGFIK